MWNKGFRLVLIIALAGLGACSEDTPVSVEAPGPVGPDLSDQLQAGFFSWPEQPFSPTNMAPIENYLKVGDTAVDFTLDDLNGESHTLSTLLATRPVMLITGSFTCGVYLQMLDQLNEFAAQKHTNGERYDEALHIVHVYVVEAHPSDPDPSPYYGVVTDHPESIPQARNYAARVANARLMPPYFQGSQLLLIDDVAPRPNNPVWCTYGTGANSAFLIDTDGTIVASQDWAKLDDLKRSANRLLSAAE